MDKNVGRISFRFVTNQAFDIQTDGQTNRLPIARPWLHSCSMVKIWEILTIGLYDIIFINF